MPLPRPDLQLPQIPSPGLDLSPVGEFDGTGSLIAYGPHRLALSTVVESDRAGSLNSSGTLPLFAGKFVWRNIGLTIASTQITVASDVQVVSEVGEIDVTSYADVSGYREYAYEYYDTRFEVKLLSDRGSTDRLVRDAYVNGTLVPVAITPRPGQGGPTNPLWGGDCFVFHLEAIRGGPGEPETISITLKPFDDDLQLGTPYALQ